MTSMGFGLKSYSSSTVGEVVTTPKHREEMILPAAFVRAGGTHEILSRRREQWKNPLELIIILNESAPRENVVDWSRH